MDGMKMGMIRAPQTHWVARLEPCNVICMQIICANCMRKNNVWCVSVYSSWWLRFWIRQACRCPSRIQLGEQDWPTKVGDQSNEIQSLSGQSLVSACAARGRYIHGCTVVWRTWMFDDQHHRQASVGLGVLVGRTARMRIAVSSTASNLSAWLQCWPKEAVLLLTEYRQASASVVCSEPEGCTPRSGSFGFSAVPSRACMLGSPSTWIFACFCESNLYDDRPCRFPVSRIVSSREFWVGSLVTGRVGWVWVVDSGSPSTVNELTATKNKITLKIIMSSLPIPFRFVPPRRAWRGRPHSVLFWWNRLFSLFAWLVV